MDEGYWTLCEGALDRIKEKTGMDLRKVAQCPICAAPVEIHSGKIMALQEWNLELNRLVEMEKDRDLDDCSRANWEFRDKIAKLENALLEQREPVQGCTCDLCGRKDGLDFSVSNEIWARVAPECMGDGSGYLCLWCFDRLALLKGIEYECSLAFAGRAGYGGDAFDAVLLKIMRAAAEGEDVKQVAIDWLRDWDKGISDEQDA